MMLNTHPFFRKLHRSEFLKNVGTLMSGTAIAQAIPVLVSPILSRIYSPDDFGVLALFMGISIVISVIATGRYELAIMLPEEKRDASNILALAVILTFFTSIITLILVLVLKDFVANFFDDPGIKNWLYFIPLVVLFTGLYNTFNYWSTRHKTFKMNAASRISQSSVMVGTNLGMGFAKTGAVGLIAGYILGQIVATSVLAWKTFRLVTAPASLIGSSIYQVFYQKATKALQEGQDIQAMVLRIYRNLFVIGLPIFAILFFFGPPIFGFVFGEKWVMAGEIASIISPWLFLNFIATPVSCITVIMNKQWPGMMLSIADLSLKITAIVIGGIKGDVYLTFTLMSIFCGTLLIFSLFLFYKFAGIKVKSAY